MFNIKNANTTINIEDTILNFGSKVLFKITNNNAERFRKIIRVVINAKKQTLNGNILLDKRSTLEFNLVNSTFKGNINKNNKAKKLVVNIDSSSTLSLTDDSYITIFNDEDKEFTNIKTNGHILYYSKKYNPSLKEQTFELDDGGKIKGI